MADPKGFIPDPPDFIPDKKPPMSDAAKIVRGAAPSIIGGAVGAAAGAIAAPFTAGVLNPVTGGMLGAAGGEAIQQYFDPFGSGEATGDPLSIAAAGAAPLAGPVAGAMARGLPGAGAGLQKFFQSQVGQFGEKLLAQFVPEDRVASDLFQRLNQAGVNIMIAGDKVFPALNELKKSAALSELPNAARTKLIKAIDKLYPTPDTYIPLEKFRVNMTDIGQLVRSLETKGGRALGDVKRLYAGIAEQFDDSVASYQGPARDLYRQAVDAYKRGLAGDVITDYFKRATTSIGGMRNVDVDGVITPLIRDMKGQLGRWLPANDQKDIVDTLSYWARRTPNAPEVGPSVNLLNLPGEALATMVSSPIGRRLVQGLQRAEIRAGINATAQTTRQALTGSGPGPGQ